jgi:phenylpyruvate tautomerase PptA (4-oxalocrotonate tautomerase family)
MNLFLEVFTPKGVLGDDIRDQIGGRLITEVIQTAEGGTSDVIERARSHAWAVVHEPAAWSVGARPVDASEAHRYLVRVTMPAGHLTEETRAQLVQRITRTLSGIDGDPARLSQEPNVWVHINEIPNGNIGGFGQVMRTSDILDMVLTGKQPGERIGTA